MGSGLSLDLGLNQRSGLEFTLGSELKLNPGRGLSLWSGLSLRLGLGFSLRSRVSRAGPGPSVESGLGLGPESSRDLAAVEAGT